jgi:hypothetical protein
MTDRRVLLLVFVGAGLAALNLAELRGGGDGIVAAPPPARIAATPGGPQAPREAVSQLLATVLVRPLFSPTRRPATGDEPVAEAFGARLTGIIVAPERRVAIFAGSGGKPLIASEGDSIDGWDVETITPNEVSLKGPTGVRTLQPKMDSTLARAQSPPQSGAAPQHPPLAGPPAGPTVRPPTPKPPAAAAFRRPGRE